MPRRNAVSDRLELPTKAVPESSEQHQRWDPSRGRERTTLRACATSGSSPSPGIRRSRWNSSEAGPPDAPGLRIDNRHALNYLLTAPGDLGLARAYIAGDMDMIGVHPADPYPLLRLMDDELRLRRPSPGEVVDLVRSAGLSSLRPVAPPPQEAIPR